VSMKQIRKIALAIADNGSLIGAVVGASLVLTGSAMLDGRAALISAGVMIFGSSIVVAIRRSK
jgi:hypothetical protein